MKLLVMFIAVAFAELRAASVRIEPAFSSVEPNDILDLKVEIDSVADLSAFQFDVRYTPSTLSAVNVTEGSFLANGGSTFFVGGDIDNTLGLISFVANTLFGSVSEVSGSGTLIIIRLESIALGSGTVDLSNGLFLDSSGNTIPVTFQGADVNTPEPAYTVMVGGALLAIAAWQRSRRLVF